MARTTPLLLQIVTGDPRPIVKQITDGIRMKIATGELDAHDQLPSVRGLAQQLMINPNTVAKAYAELSNEGWLEARAGLGLFVTTRRQRLSDEERQRRLDEAMSRLVHEAIALGYTREEVIRRLDHELRQLERRSA